MANIKITDLTAYTDPVSTDVLPIVDVGNDLTKKVSIADLLENAGTGSAGAPSFSFDGDNAGIYRPGANQLAISTNGIGRLFVNSSGNVGVGIASPAHRVHIAGTTTPELIVEDTSNNVKAVVGADNTVARIGSDSNHPLTLRTNDTERLRITSTGQLSHIGGGSTGSPAVGFNGSAPSNSLVIDSTGNVGVGVQNPSEKLEVYGNARFKATDGSHGIEFYPDVTGLGYQRIISYNRTSSAYEDLSFGVNDFVVTSGATSESLRITSAGLVGIGTSNPTNGLTITSGELNTQGSIETNNQVKISVNDSGGYAAYLSYGQGDYVNSPYALSLQSYHNGSASTSDILLAPLGGSVGIGTQDPQAKLEVDNGAPSGTLPTLGGLLVTNGGTAASTAAVCVATGSGPIFNVMNDGVVTVDKGFITLNGNKLGAVKVEIDNDSFATITPPRAGCGYVTVVEGGDEQYPNANCRGFLYADWNSSPVASGINLGSLFEVSNAGPPNGTTGNDDHATLFSGGATGKLYLENRLGGSSVFFINFI